MELAKLEGDKTYTANLAFSQTENYLALSVTGKTQQIGVKIMQLNATAVTTVRFIDYNEQVIYRVALSPDGKNVAAYTLDDKVTIWDTTTGTKIQTLNVKIKDGAFFDSMLYTEDRLMLGTRQTMNLEYPIQNELSVYVYNKNSKDITKFIEKYELYTFPITEENTHLSHVEFSIKGTYVASGSGNKVLLIKVDPLIESNVFDVVKFSYHTHQHQVNCVAFSSDEKLLISGSSDKNVIIWDIEKQTALFLAFSVNNSVMSVAFSPDNKYVMGLDINKEVFYKLYDDIINTKPGGRIITTKSSNVAFSPDSKNLVIRGLKTILLKPLYNLENEGGRKKTRRRRRRGGRRSHQRMKRKTFKKARKITRKRI
jgi:WD40 repeat protein